MNKELQKLYQKNKLDEIYNEYRIYSIKQICKNIGTWELYTDETKKRLENLTPYDSKINKSYDYDGGYLQKYNYSEIVRQDVDKIIEDINNRKQLSEKDIFIDIGSGCGKLLLHMSLFLNIGTYIGLEQATPRSDFANHIKMEVLPHDEKIFLLNKSYDNFNLFIGTIFFVNIDMDIKKYKELYETLPKGSLIYMKEKVNDNYIKEFKCQTYGNSNNINIYVYQK